MNWITIEKTSQETGMTKESLRALKKKGMLREKLHWVKGPNGRIFFNMSALEHWITGSNV